MIAPHRALPNTFMVCFVVQSYISFWREVVEGKGSSDTSVHEKVGRFQWARQTGAFANVSELFFRLISMTSTHNQELLC